MKKRSIKLILLSLAALFAFGMTSCTKVPAGNVGVKFYLLGTDKGVDTEELKPGKYWIGVNEELYLFPTFDQNYVWTQDEREGSENNESITFQSTQGGNIGADVGITYRIDPTKVSDIFAKYKRGIDEITDIFLRNMVRDAFVRIASTMKIEDINGKDKGKLLDDVLRSIQLQVGPIGIIVDKIYLVGKLRLPRQVVDAINEKMTATQKAETKELQLREAKAESAKMVELARGKNKANEKLTKSITPALIKFQQVENQKLAIEKWNGVLPQMTGGVTPMIDVSNVIR